MRRRLVAALVGRELVGLWLDGASRWMEMDSARLLTFASFGRGSTASKVAERLDLIRDDELLCWISQLQALRLLRRVG